MPSAARVPFSRARGGLRVTPCVLALAWALAHGLGTVARAAGPDAVAALVGDARCEADSECRTIAVGRQGCGGPAGWLAWSASRTDEAALAAALQAPASGPSPGLRDRMSTCGIVADPGAFCARADPPSGPGPAPSGTCRLRPKRSTATPASDR